MAKKIVDYASRDLKIEVATPWIFDPKHSDATPGHDGTRGNDTLMGTQGKDIMYGDGGIDRFFGGAGDDHIVVGSNSSRTIADPYTYVSAGVGDDFIKVPSGTRGTFQLNTGEGADLVLVQGGDLVVIDAVRDGSSQGDAFLFDNDFRGEALIMDYDNGVDSLIMTGPSWQIDPNDARHFFNANGGDIYVAGPINNYTFAPNWDF